MLKIGKVNLKNGIMLAPMAGVADSAFRRICFEYGAEYAVSEMVSAKAVCYGDKKTVEIAALSEYEYPTAIQLFGHEPENLATAARKLLTDKSYQGSILPVAVDLNCGCPVPKIVGGGDGSAMMKTPELIGECISSLKKAVSEVSDLPVTVKIRAGWSRTQINAVEVAKICEQAGADLIAVHGRTREQMYLGKADRTVIAEVKRAVTVPVIGNGDIESYSDLREMVSETGCDGVMIGRGCLGNPFLFRELAFAFDGKTASKPKISEIAECAERHLGYIIADKGEHTGILQARKHLSWYIKGIRGSAKFRDLINRAESFDEVKKLLSDIVSTVEEPNEKEE